jgi:hypothetical protein
VHFLLEIRVRLLLDDLLHDARAQVFVVEAQGMPRLVTDDAAKFSLAGLHGEGIEVERRLVVVFAENVRADQRPVAVIFQARDSHLAEPLRFGEAHVRRPGPGVHVQKNARAQSR